jgi:TonB family protein
MFKYFIIAVLLFYSSLINGQDIWLVNDSIINSELKQTPADSLAIIDDSELFVSFPGGLNALNDYLKANLIYPDSAVKLGLSGRVIVSFWIDNFGKISKIKIERGDYSLLNKEVVKLISSMPDWVWDERIALNSRRSTRRALSIYFDLNENKNKPSR